MKYALISVAGLVAAALVAIAPALERASARRDRLARIDRLQPVAVDRGPGCGVATAAAPTNHRATSPARLASWHTVGGCGAGSGTGIGGIKWIGRNVTGGLVGVQCQGSYTRYGNGFVYSFDSQLTVPLTDAWSLGVSVPYLYKWVDDPLQLGFDLSNRGVGDVNALLTWRLGAVRATAITLSVGAPTGAYDAHYNGFILPQDRQLGGGKVSAGMMIDHTFDNLWGPAVIGASGTYPGGVNDLGNYRAPSASAYGYVGYLLGPFVPAAGLSGTFYKGADRDVGLASDGRANAMAALNASLEWSNDWIAILAGASLPYSHSGLEPWTAGLGFAIAPF
jgi:hypothetical protein